jgi:hypothetical protein
MRITQVSGSRAVAFAILAGLSFASVAGKPTASSSVPLRASVFTTFYDEQDTNAYFNNPQTCPYYGQAAEEANLLPDALTGPTTQWDYFNWTPKSELQSATYEDKTYCAGASCLRAEFSTNDKVFSLDTRSASPARKLSVDFTQPYGTISDVSFAGSVVTTPVLFQVSGVDPITTMAVCSSTACPEARQINTKLWFNDPTASDVMWRVDWPAIRVLRVAENKWYFIAGQCGGSHLAGLSKLVGNRTKPRETLNGHFLVPLFIAAERK